jgi:hypothetical protein
MSFSVSEVIARWHVFATSLAFVACTLLVVPARGLEAGLALTAPDLMERLQERGFSLRALLAPVAGQQAKSAMANDAIFALKPMTPIRNKIRDELWNLREKDPKERNLEFEPYEPAVLSTIQKDPGQSFDFKYIYSPAGRLELVGVVNRMDRAFVVRNDSPGNLQTQEATCGEIRFIYRFSYIIDPTGPAGRLESRLPMTLNLILNARRPGAQGQPSCQAIARRWQALATSNLTGEALAAALVAPNGALTGLSGRNIDRIELNIQVLRLKVAHKSDTGGHAEYLLRVFRWDPQNSIFQESRLENQIDRDKMIRREAAAKRFVPGLLERFKDWLRRPDAMAALDAGTLVIPHEFLAQRAVSIAPGGAARSQNDPFRDMFSDNEIEAAISALKASGRQPQTLMGPESFRLRLAQTSCSGCHQSRAIAGFHFPGADRMGESADAFASNQVFVPASAHFYADLPRRKAVVDAFSAGTTRDYFRYFAARADERHRVALNGTELLDGWGSNCVLPGTSDPALSGWTCRADLQYRVLHASTTHPSNGVCIGKNQVLVGDPMEFGAITTVRFGDDTYRRITPPQDTPYTAPPAPAWCGPGGGACLVSHQQQIGSSGGFPAGMLRLKSCANLPTEATCGYVAGDGFNKCITSKQKTFKQCLKDHKAMAGLRACDIQNPCREDYICTARHSDLATAKPGKGTCIPPYFMFQFRSDGHPDNWTPIVETD